MSKRIAVIGVGNMAKAIVSGIKSSKDIEECEFYLYDVVPTQCDSLIGDGIYRAESISEAVLKADCVLLSVKPQNFPEVLPKIASIDGSCDKLYITIAAGITVSSIAAVLNTENIVRVLPNLPMLISKGVSAVCYNDKVSDDDFDFVVKVFESAGSVLKISEEDMNRTIGVTSSSPAYVFKFIKAICDGARSQGLSEDGLLEAVCDMVIGSAELIKHGFGSPENMISAVASKGGTTEKALAELDRHGFESAVVDAMIACTGRADELGKGK